MKIAVRNDLLKAVFGDGAWRAYLDSEYIPERDDVMIEVTRSYQAGEITKYWRDSQVRYLMNSLVRAEDRFEIREAGGDFECQGGDGPCPNNDDYGVSEFECECPSLVVWDKQLGKPHYETPIGIVWLARSWCCMYLDEEDAVTVRDAMIDAAQKGEL
jgi:hypothetical protein